MGHLGPKDVSSHNSWTLSPIFTYKTSFYPESKIAFIKIMNPRKILSIWGLGPRNCIWATPKNVSSHNSWTITPIFTYKTSFYPKSKVAFIKTMKSRKMLSIWGLGPRNCIWATWAQKIYLAITPKPYHQFLHARPHFIHNQKLLSFKLWNLEKSCQFGVWGLETTFGSQGPIRFIKSQAQNRSSKFKKQQDNDLRTKWSKE